MFSVASCTKCNAQVRLPGEAAPESQVRCPLCHSEYELSEALATLPPALVLVEAAGGVGFGAVEHDSPLNFAALPHDAGLDHPHDLGPDAHGVDDFAAPGGETHEAPADEPWAMGDDSWSETDEPTTQPAGHEPTVAFRADDPSLLSPEAGDWNLGGTGLDENPEAFAFSSPDEEGAEAPADIHFAEQDPLGDGAHPAGANPFAEEGAGFDGAAFDGAGPHGELPTGHDPLAEHDSLPEGSFGEAEFEAPVDDFQFPAEPTAEAPEGEFGGPEFGGGELGAADFGAAEFGAAEAGAGEFGSSEFGAGENESGANEFGGGGFGAGEFGAGEFGAGAEGEGSEFAPSNEFQEEEIGAGEIPSFGGEGDQGDFGPIEGFESPEHAMGGPVAGQLGEGEFKLPAGDDDGEEIGFMPAHSAEDEDDKPKGKKGAKGKAAKGKAKPARGSKAKKSRSLAPTLLFLLFGGLLSLTCAYLAALKFVGKSVDVLGVAHFLPAALAPPDLNRGVRPTPFPAPSQPVMAEATPPAPAEPGAEPAAMTPDGAAPGEAKPAGEPPAAEAPAPGAPPAKEPDLNELMASPADKPNVAAPAGESLDDLLLPKPAGKAKPAPAAEDDLLGSKPAPDDGFGPAPKKKPGEMPADDLLGEKPAAEPAAPAPAPGGLDDLLAPEKPAKAMKPADDLPGFDDKPAATPKPAEPEMEEPAKAPKPAKGALDDLLPSEPEPAAKPAKPEMSDDLLSPEPKAPAKPAKPEMPDDLLSPEPKAPGKSLPADDPLMADEKPAKPAPPAEPVEEPAPAPIAPLGAASYAAADVEAALEAAETNDATMSAPDAIPPEDLKKAKALYFRSLYKLGEVLTNAAEDPAEPFVKKDRAAALSLLKKIAADPNKLGEVSNAAGKWLKYPKRGEHSGIVLSGAVQSVTQQGKLYEVSIAIPGQDEPVSVVSQKKPAVGEGDQVLVLGSVIDDPAASLPDYAGKQPNVIWQGLTVKLPVGESG